MPIKDPTIYPRHWKQFSEYIRFERAGNKCEKCGVPNREVVERGFLSPVQKVPVWVDGHGQTYHAETGEYLGQFHTYYLDLRSAAEIVLTVAHRDAEGDICDCQKRTGYLCANPKHCLALCQACHNAYDAPKRRANASRTISEKNDKSRGLFNL